MLNNVLLGAIFTEKDHSRLPLDLNLVSSCVDSPRCPASVVIVPSRYSSLV